MFLLIILVSLAVVRVGIAAEGRAPIEITVGSKKFTESVILGEMLRQLAEVPGHRASHQRALGGTRLVWNALRAGDIDAYPEYTGTLLQEVLFQQNLRTTKELQEALAKHSLRMSAPLGFNNTYAIGVKETLAKRLNLETISDLRRHPELVLGFGNEFMDRADGWPGLKRRYQLPHQNVRGLDHDLAYRGIAAGTLHVTDLYATDAEIAHYDLRPLRDDLNYFPTYHAVILYRADLVKRAPKVVALFQRLAGTLDETTMATLNARVKLRGEAETQVAAHFIQSALAIQVTPQSDTAWNQFWKHTGEHLLLVSASLFAAIMFAVPLGIVAARRPRLGQGILGIVGIIQTIPALALFVFMIPFLGIGGPPAIVALFLYSLLPIVRNTYAGLKDIPPAMRESAEALGLPRGAQLRLVELPLCARAILAGIKTSAVLNVGTATLAALIGAGGYGQPILTGIRLDDVGLILQGAIPAAMLALFVQGGFEVAERLVVPQGLRLKTVISNSP